jgi:hypothetical protein
VSPKRLLTTQSVWSEIREQVLGLVSELREKHDLAIRRQTLAARARLFQSRIPALFAGVAPPHVRPRTVDLALLPAVQAVLDAPGPAELAPDSFDALKPELTALTRRWRADAMTALLRGIRSAQRAAGEAPRKDVNPLELARTQFRCRACRRALGAQAALVHGCGQGATTAGKRPAQVTYADLVSEALSAVPWDAGGFDWARCVARTDGVVRAAGLVPELATAKDMDAVDGRYSCDACRKPRRSWLVMGWRTAVCFSPWTLSVLI